MNGCKNNYILVLCFFTILLTSCPLYAVNLTPQQEQTLKSSEYNPGSLLMQRMKEIQRIMTDSEAEKMKENAAEEQKETEEKQKPDVPEATIELKKLEIPDSEVLTREELDQISEKYSGKTLTIAGLYEAIDEINDLYAKKGFITTRAILPPQKIEDNIVKVMLIEGKIGQVVVENNKSTKTAYIKRCLKVPEGVIPNVREISRNIQKFNTLNKTMLQIKMVAGEKPLTTDIYIVAVEPKKRRNVVLFSDNSGGESSGKYRFGLAYNDLNVSGRCDIFSLSTMYTRTSETGMISYNTPLGYNGDRLTISHNANHMRVNKGYMKDLDVRGKSRSETITYNKAVNSTINKRNELIVEFQKQKSETKILGNDFVRDRDQRISISYSAMKVKNDKIFYLKPTYTYNTHKNIDGENFHGDRITLDSMWQKYQKKGDILTVRVSAQKELSNFIPSSDQYYLGGQYSVRGYNENVIGGDAGVNAKIDYSFHTKKKGLNFITFFDWGRLNGETILTTKEIYSAGFGFEYQHKGLYISVYTGYPLKRKIGDQKVDKNLTNFSLSYSF